jgi:hypothetical protein
MGKVGNPPVLLDGYDYLVESTPDSEPPIDLDVRSRVYHGSCKPTPARYLVLFACSPSVAAADDPRPDPRDTFPRWKG